MQEELPPRIEVTPKIQGVSCRCLLYGLYILLNFTPFIVGGVLWYKYNFWIGIAFFLFLTLVGGIIFSKLRIASIPSDQREMDYSNFAIIKWFLSKRIC